MELALWALRMELASWYPWGRERRILRWILVFLFRKIVDPWAECPVALEGQDVVKPIAPLTVTTSIQCTEGGMQGLFIDRLYSFVRDVSDFHTTVYYDKFRKVLTRK
jgi:hypothetical protein